MTSPSPAATLKPGDRVRLPSGETTTLTRAYHPEQPRERVLWLTPRGNYFESELTLVEAAPPPPPVEGPGLATVLRETLREANARIANDPEWWAQVDKANAALAAEEARERIQREALALAQRDCDEARRLLRLEQEERRAEQRDHENFVEQMREALRCAPGKDAYYTARALRAELDRLNTETSR